MGELGVLARGAESCLDFGDAVDDEPSIDKASSKLVNTLTSTTPAIAPDDEDVLVPLKNPL
jgi:hypothetical protein